MMRFFGKLHPIARHYADYPVPLRTIRPLGADEAAAAYDALRDPANIAQLGQKEAAYPSAVCYYRPPFLTDIFRAVGDHIRRFLDFDIVETYYYARLYGRGDQLKIHTDRGSCFVSVSLCFGYDYSDMFPAGSAWPIGVLEDHASAAPRETLFQMQPGDGMLYPGCSVPHWRDVFLGPRCGQAFFHWVPADPTRFAEFYGDPNMKG
jgi:hypothetical protein